MKGASAMCDCSKRCDGCGGPLAVYDGEAYCPMCVSYTINIGVCDRCGKPAALTPTNRTRCVCDECAEKKVLG